MRQWLKLILSLSLAFLITACGGNTPPQPSEPEQSGVTVNDFTGQTRDEVEAWKTANNVGDDAVVYAYAYSETIAKDKVISQSIPAGATLEGTLTVTISNGPDPQAEISLIDFSGMNLEEIQQWFINEHFEKVSIEYVYDPSVPVGQFIGTSASDGKACRDEPVIVTISGDPEQAGVAVFVPDMNGWNRDQAEQWANENQITIDYSTVKSPTVPFGYVVSQNPDPNTEIIKGDRIQVVLSDGADIAAFDMTGMSGDEINAWGQQNGIQISWIQCWSGYPSGMVYWNQPNDGTIRIGDIMKVYISVGPIPVQDFTGLSFQNNFLGWINSINDQYYQSANLKYTITTRETPDADDGVILEQNPGGGYLDPGSTIELVVADHVDPEPDPKVSVPSLTGYEESSFIDTLHSLGVREGNRTEQFSKAISQGYIISNDTGDYDPDSTIDYVVSLGEFRIVPQFWAGQDFDDLVDFIDSSNRMGAGVTLEPDYVNTSNIDADNHIQSIDGPLDDGVIHVTVQRFVVY